MKKKTTTESFSNITTYYTFSIQDIKSQNQFF